MGQNGVLQKKGRKKSYSPPPEDRNRDAGSSLYSVFMYSPVLGRRGEVVDFKVDYVNDHGLSLSGTTWEKVAGRRCSQLYKGYKTKGAFDGHKKAFQEQRMVQGESSLKVNGSPHWFYKVLLPTRDGVAAIVWDVTEKRRMEERLVRSESNLSALIDNLPYPIFLVDVKLNLIAFNYAFAEQFCMAFGKKPAMGKSLTSLLPGEEYGYWNALMVRVMSGRRLTVERSFRVGGEENIYEFSVNPVITEGKVTGATCFARNVTRKRQAEVALRESEERYRDLFQHARDAIYISAEDGQILDVNPAALDLFGYKREEFLKLKAPEVYVNVEDRKRLKAEIEKRGYVRDFYTRLYRKDGSIMHCLFTTAMRSSQDGRMIGYQGIIRDITALKQAEDALRESSQFNQAIIYNAAEGIIVYNRNLEHVLWNKTMEKLTGLSSETVIGKKAADLFPHLKKQGVDRLHRLALRGETCQSKDVYFEIPGTGKSGWMIGTYSPHYNSGGEIVGVIAIVTDITERKHAEEKLFQMTQQKLKKEIKEQRIRSQSLLEGQEEERKRISRELHDSLGQMLTAVRLKFEAVQNESPAALKTKLKEIRDLLNQTISESRRISYNLMPSILDDFGLVSALKYLCNQVPQQNGTKIKFQSVGMDARLDLKTEKALYRIAQESLNNAVKYAHAQEISIQLIRHKDGVTLSVEDDGKGFNTRTLLNPGNATKRGKGLYNMQEYVSILKGRLNIDSGPGKGTLISVEVPVRKTEAKRRSKDKKP